MTTRPDGTGAEPEQLVLSMWRLLRYGGIPGLAGLALGLPGEPGPWWAAARGSGPLSTFSPLIARRMDRLALRAGTNEDSPPRLR